MSLELVEVSPDIWVNIGGGNVEVVHHDGPMFTDNGPRVIIRFTSGNSKLMANGEKMGHVIAKLTDGCFYEKRDADQAGFVDVCVNHNEVSDLPESDGPRRFCAGSREGKLHRAIKNQPLMPYIPQPPPFAYTDVGLGPVARFFSRGRQ